jgi:hypothetical protein
VSEATGADIQALGVERGHRTLVVVHKDGKVVTIPLAPRTARAIDLAIGERTEGPTFLTADGRRLDRHGARRTVRRIARQAGIEARSHLEWRLGNVTGRVSHSRLGLRLEGSGNRAPADSLASSAAIFAAAPRASSPPVAV